LHPARFAEDHPDYGPVSFCDRRMELLCQSMMDREQIGLVIVGKADAAAIGSDGDQLFQGRAVGTLRQAVGGFPSGWQVDNLVQESHFGPPLDACAHGRVTEFLGLE
jgi:hypothetical protein